ncbi:unnamed protein product [Parascedosporium putredinis]|uniref:Uncharacterized protein n=1 Tax=Parascedosporium putredinis TaxID=1442378 RepID=A0A9P1GU49_9PEZI|nr:unnamed protein product [Parascedosporium putredinis]CAI7987437.1 unnamed protein product [Parascedosporium putredinis]
MDLNYTSLPPQLSIVRAIKAGHVLIGVVCFIALLANVLAVGLGGIFNEKPVLVTYPVELQNLHSAKFDLAALRPTTRNDARQRDNMISVKSNFTLGTEMPPWVTAEYYFQPFELSATETTEVESISGLTRGYGLDITCGDVTLAKPINETLLNTTVIDVSSYKKERGITDERCVDFPTLAPGRILNETASVEAARIWCRGGIILYWGRGGVRAFPATAADWHSDGMSGSWLTEIMKADIGNDFINPNEPNPEESLMVSSTMDVWRRSFSYFLGSGVVPYEPLEEDAPKIAGTATVTETRIFMSNSAFLISIVIMAIYVVLAAYIYGSPMGFFLPRMPTSIAAIVEMIAPSTALRDSTPVSEARFAFGRYIGKDGGRHVGIEYAELVMPASPHQAHVQDATNNPEAN